jgi:hypothetical protein
VIWCLVEEEDKKLRGRQNVKLKTLERTIVYYRSPMQKRRNEKEENIGEKEQGNYSNEGKKEKAT